MGPNIKVLFYVSALSIILFLFFYIAVSVGWIPKI
jgi:hypothetical protein